MPDNLHEKKDKKTSDRLTPKQVNKMLKKSRKAALNTARVGHSGVNIDDRSSSVIHVKDPRDLLKFGASAVKQQVNYVKKNLAKDRKKTFEEFINQ